MIDEKELEYLKQNDLINGITAPMIYSNVSMTQLSIARHVGGARVNGFEYIYNPKTDELVREDVLKKLAKMRKENHENTMQSHLGLS